MDAFNHTLTSIFDKLLGPFVSWPLSTLVGLAVVSGLLMTLVFKYVSNQAALGTVLDQGRGNALAIKLFKDDLRGMFLSLANVFLLMLKRIWYSLSPVLLMIVPLFFLLSQLFLRYEYRPLRSDESAVVKFSVDPTAWETGREFELVTGEGVEIETPGLRDEQEQAVYWRVSATDAGSGVITLSGDEATVTKVISVAEQTDPLAVVSSNRVSSGIDAFWYAGEKTLQSEVPIRRISVNYPRRELLIFGWDIPWWLTFFVVSIAAALLSQPFLKVRF